MNKLQEIVAYKKIELIEAKKKRPLAELEKKVKQRSPARDFRKAIVCAQGLGLIAEVKRASPSAGPIRAGADAVSVARVYRDAGAHAVSVLTDAKFFSGSLEDLRAVRQAVVLPVLRKDFLLEEYQLIEAAAAGADAVLLIAAVLERPVLKRLMGLARDLSLDPLVEVHTRRELEAALEAGALLVGINNRNLETLEVDLKTTAELMPMVPPDRTVVSESGIRTRQDVEVLQRQGIRAILVGEELMKAPDPAKKIKELMGW
ncbi:MAG: indole-3-glycerol phosphate synthase TrpC [Candidatus Omnitrophica bacterium]|nr:indole-3-glycerol phosphate synthase TrpC [Candidatus Omnitrophota bacterium]